MDLADIMSRAVESGCCAGVCVCGTSTQFFVPVKSLESETDFKNVFFAKNWVCRVPVECCGVELNENGSGCQKVP